MNNDDDVRLNLIFGETGARDAETAARKSDVRFIRGRAQLTRMQEHHRYREPQGHVLTAGEAFEAYGLDVLEEATEYGSALLLREPNAAGNRIRRQRESLGLLTNKVARAAAVSTSDLQSIERSSGRDAVSVQDIERVAFVLGLDEGQIAYQGVPEDSAIAARLKRLGSSPTTPGGLKLSPASVLTLAEAASVIRTQHRLMDKLGIRSSYRFEPDGYYGAPHASPAWRLGNELSTKARDILDLSQEPIGSMRELVEEKLCIPIVRAELYQDIAGATIAVADGPNKYRGIVVNLRGDNKNPLVTRATIAHEMAHLFFDPDERLEKVTVDTYDGLARDPNVDDNLPEGDDYRIEQRANAFAINFLAPVEAVRNIAPPPFDDVSRVVSEFGISVTAASYHVANASYRHEEAPLDVPYDDGAGWRGKEDFTVDYFPLRDTPYTRRGRFAILAVKAWRSGFISEATAAQYLCCSDSDFLEHAANIA